MVKLILFTEKLKSDYRASQSCIAKKSLASGYRRYALSIPSQDAGEVRNAAREKITYSHDELG
jgi:hypothetical protein